MALARHSVRRGSRPDREGEGLMGESALSMNDDVISKFGIVTGTQRARRGFPAPFLHHI